MVGEIIQILLCFNNEVDLSSFFPPKNDLTWTSKTAFIHFVIPSLPRGCKVLEKVVLAAVAQFLKSKWKSTVAFSNYRLFSSILEEHGWSGWHNDRTLNRSHALEKFGETLCSLL